MPKAPTPLQSAPASQPARPAPQRGPRPDARQRALITRAGGRALEGLSAAALARAPTSAASRSTSSSTCASSSTPGSAPDLYRDGLRIYTTLDLDMQQAAERALEAQLEAIEAAAPTASSPHQTYAAVPRSGAERRRHRAPPTTPYLQGLVRHPRGRRPATSAPWWAGATSRTASSIARPRRCASPARPSSRSSTRRRSRPGIPLSTIMVDEPLTVEIAGHAGAVEPQNYDIKFDGPMTLRQRALQSRNIIADQARAWRSGEEAVIDEATPLRPHHARSPPCPRSTSARPT